MKHVLLLCRSLSLIEHIERVFEGYFELHVSDSLPDATESQGDGAQIIIVHSQSFATDLDALLQTLTARENSIVAVTSDIPKVDEMLALSRWGIRGFCNSYMADLHYQQLVRMLFEGQSWFPPWLLQEVLQLASRSNPVTNTENSGRVLESLTKREDEVARLISRGMANREIAEQCNIAERTVKAHLTHIYQKLDIRDRVTLALYVSKQMSR